MSGREWEDSVIELAKLYKWLVHHVRPAKTEKGWRSPISGHPGFPDCVLARDGRVIFAELKTGKAVLDANQKAWRDALTDTLESLPLVEWFCWYPKDWDEIVEVLR